MFNSCLKACISCLTCYFTAVQLKINLNLTYQTEIWHTAQSYYSNKTIDFKMFAAV